MADPIFEDILEELKELNRAGGTPGAKPAGPQQRATSSRVAGLDLFDRQAREGAKTVKDYIDTTRRATEEERQNARRKQQLDAERQALEQSIQKAIVGTTQGFLNFGRQLSGSPGNFTALNTVIGVATKTVSSFASKFGPIGAAIGALGEAAGEVAKFMVDQFQEAYGKFEELSGTGVVRTFEDMTRASQATGLTFNDLTSVLGKNSKELAAFGGSAVLGRERIESLAYASQDARRDFQKLGVSQLEYTEYQLSYIDQERKAGRLKGKTDAQLLAGTNAYVEELDKLSKITGLSRKDLQAERESRLSNARYRAGIANLDEKARKNIDGFLDQIKASAPDMQEGFQDLIASGGVPVTEAAKKVFNQLNAVGTNATDLVQGMRDGSVTAAQAMNQLGEAGKAFKDKATDLTAIKGAETAVTTFAVSMLNLSERTNKTDEQIEEENETRKKNLAATEGQNAELAKTKTQMYESSRRIQEMAVSSELATKAMSFMADGIDLLTEKMYELAGKELPAHLKARKEERAAIAAEKKVREELAEAADKAQASMETMGSPESPVSTEQIVAARIKAEEEARKKVEAAAAATRAATKKREAEEAKAGVGRATGQPAAQSPDTVGGGRGRATGPMPGDFDKPPGAPAARPPGDIISALGTAGITDKTAQANILAQIQAESGGKPRSENLNYSGQKLFELFGTGNKAGNKVRFRTMDEANALASKGEEAIGNVIYGGRMGNAADEGFKYRGRGLIQLTGKSNYKKFGDMIGVDLVGNPDLANDPQIAQQIAVAYFADKQKSGVNLSDINAVSKAVGHATGSAGNKQRSALAQSFSTSLASAPSSSTILAKSEADTTSEAEQPSVVRVSSQTASERESMMEIKNGFAMMNSKYDAIIDLLGNSNRYQKQTATNTG